MMDLLGHRRDLMLFAAMLLRDLEVLNDELFYHCRPRENVRSDLRRLKEQWRVVMDELSANHA